MESRLTVLSPPAAAPGSGQAGTLRGALAYANHARPGMCTGPAGFRAGSGRRFTDSITPAGQRVRVPAFGLRGRPVQALSLYVRTPWAGASAEAKGAPGEQQ